MSVFLVFPHQLFDPKKYYSDVDQIHLIEEPLFFADYDYLQPMHKQKILLHRASMELFAQMCVDNGTKVNYIDYQKKNLLGSVLAELSKQNIETVKTYEVVDYTLEKRIKASAQENNIQIDWLTTPMFLNSTDENKSYRDGKKRWFMADFYKWQRKRLNILTETDDQPVGGQWSFDEENRKKLPKKMVVDLPALTPCHSELVSASSYIQGAKKYVQENFTDHPGYMSDFMYPIDHASAAAWLEKFLIERFELFGPYEDAIVPKENWLYHSVLTPMMNIGLLTPQQVVDRALEFAEKNDVPLNSLEGFIRQIIGWREFMRATYEDLGVQMRNGNYWNHERTIPASFYDGTTGIEPIDDTIRRIKKFGYCHHIERLMVLGGFMFLCEFHPQEIYRWFMEMFIDSYDWVMVTNVFAMSQNSCGGLITTKPYFSGSNYVRKMSHYPKGDWCDTWDGLYWSFIINHSPSLKKNPRWAMMCRMAEKMDVSKKERHQLHAKKFFSVLDQKA